MVNAAHAAPLDAPAEQCLASQDTPSQRTHCYVCFEIGSGLVQSPCHCIDQYIHVECLLKCVAATGKIHCTICTAEYPGVSITSITKTSLSYRGFRAICVTITLFLSIVAAGVVTSWAVQCKNINQAHVMGKVAGSVLLIITAQVFFFAFVSELTTYVQGQWLFLNRHCDREARMCKHSTVALKRARTVEHRIS